MVLDIDSLFIVPFLDLGFHPPAPSTHTNGQHLRDDHEYHYVRTDRALSANLHKVHRRDTLVA